MRSKPDGHEHLDYGAGPLFEGSYRDGATYDDTLDRVRLNKQHSRVARLMMDRGWRSLRQISTWTGDPEASVSARLRDFRKPRFGSHTVERKRSELLPGLWVYRLTLNPEVQLTFDELEVPDA